MEVYVNNFKFFNGVYDVTILLVLSNQYILSVTTEDQVVSVSHKVVIFFNICRD